MDIDFGVIIEIDPELTRRRQVVAENATAQIANGRIAAENVRDPGSISDPIEKLAVSKINSNTPEFIFVGKWWGLPR